MSHTLHRMGNKVAMRGDWVVVAMSARGVNRRGSIPRLRRFLRMSLKYGPVNFGDMRSGSFFTKGPRALLLGMREDSLLNVVFDSEQALGRFLEELGRARLGLSVVVSGLLEQGCRCARRAGLVPHTLAMSLGAWGRTNRLPDARTMEITTMCGHGLISPAYVRLMVGKAAAGTISASEAAAELAKPCVCGVFNPVRAADLLGKLSRGNVSSARSRASHGDGGSSPKRSKRATGVRS